MCWGPAAPQELRLQERSKVAGGRLARHSGRAGQRVPAAEPSLARTVSSASKALRIDASSVLVVMAPRDEHATPEVCARSARAGQPL